MIFTFQARRSDFLAKATAIILLISVVVLSLAFSFSNRADAVPASCEWDGSASGLWSNTANWTNCGGVVPQTGDRLYFQPGAANTSTTNDLAAGSVFEGVTFNTSGYNVDGNAITLTSVGGDTPIIFNSGGNVWSIDTTITGTSTQNVFNTGDNMFNGRIIFDISNSADFYISSTGASDILRLGGIISGDVDGTLFLNSTGGRINVLSSNTFTAGSVEISVGATAVCASGNCMGNALHPVNMYGNAALNFIAGNYTFSNPITTTGDEAQINAYTTFILDSSVTIGGDIHFNTVVNGETFELAGGITGTGDVYYTGTGDANDFVVAGSANNDYVGITFITDAGVRLQKSLNGTAIPGEIQIFGDSVAATLFVDSDEQIADDAPINTINGAQFATLRVSALTTETIGNFIGVGRIVLDASTSVLNINGAVNPIASAFSGEIQSAEGEIHKVGASSAWTFDGSFIDFAGQWPVVYVDEGNLILDVADSSAGNVPMFVSDGVLSVLGTVGPIVSTGFGGVSPTNSPECFNAVGNVSISSPAAYAFDFTSNVPCIGYDVLEATGTLALNNANLFVHTSAGYNSPLGTVMTIARAANITGIFAGKPDGFVWTQTVNSTKRYYRFNYTATTITMTRTNADGTITVASDQVVSPPTNSAAGTLVQTGVNTLTSIWTVVILLAIGCALSFRGVKRRRIS